jgi:hypothetical protein
MFVEISINRGWSQQSLAQGVETRWDWTLHVPTQHVLETRITRPCAMMPCSNAFSLVLGGLGSSRPRLICVRNTRPLHATCAMLCASLMPYGIRVFEADFCIRSLWIGAGRGFFLRGGTCPLVTIPRETQRRTLPHMNERMTPQERYETIRELNNPMTAVLGYLDLALNPDQIDDPKTPVHPIECTKKAFEQAKRAHKLVLKLLSDAHLDVTGLA